ncbi:MAG: 16S rRNA (cytosine(1402)-N(4))-methyltransferase RsmH [Bacteroidia bacterium]|nr:16S rRNA (cytosine(1402)-N(4))-methyltransferase RsmH [Bacteroidia bacterium]MDW8157669.1 16S rRNA (cytosine(1402)-N(4))-methyltransferase RsmH [Bacteroidia bacterium]
MEYHRPVMVEEVLRFLIQNKDGFYIDATFGGGGHSQAILNNLSENGYLLGIDQDEDAQLQAAKIKSKNFSFCLQNFEHLEEIAKKLGIESRVEGILADLGVSMHQLKKQSRGFSFQGDSLLDMRMSKVGDKDAKYILNTYSYYELVRIFRDYGELPNAAAIAKAIVEYRQKQPICSTQELNDCLKKILPPFNDWKVLAPIYQAIRIEVNEELRVLQKFLEGALAVLRKGGILVVISYHSLEDRLVKKFLQSGNFEGIVSKDFFGKPLLPWKVLTRKPITPSPQEVMCNPSARSAKLRAAIKL